MDRACSAVLGVRESCVIWTWGFSLLSSVLLDDKKGALRSQFCNDSLASVRGKQELEKYKRVSAYFHGGSC